MSDLAPDVQPGDELDIRRQKVARRVKNTTYPALGVLVELVAVAALVADHPPEVLVGDGDFARVSARVVVRPNVVDERRRHAVMVPKGTAELPTTADDAASRQDAAVDGSLQQLLAAL